jgi:DNA-binding transcriptional LysR family regulator
MFWSNDIFRGTTHTKSYGLVLEHSMNLDLPPLTWLRAFEAAARTLSFTHAAAELQLTQAAISKHVKSLEHHLHQPLFLRHPRGLELTKSGAAYLPKVQDALQLRSTPQLCADPALRGVVCGELAGPAPARLP